jgi:ATP:ADP antiporter, AAA family
MQGKDDGSGAVWSAAVASGALVAQIVAGKATRDTLFLTHFGLKLLPAAMIGAALLSSLSVIGISRALTKYGPARIVPVTFGLGAVLFLVEWWLCLRDEHVASIVVYAHTAVFGAAGNSAFWSLVNERFDPHAAKKMVGRIASGGTIGGVVGGIAAWRASAQLSVPMMLALLAGMNVVGLWGALRTVPSEVRRGTLTPEVVTTGGVRALRETPYLRDLALLVVTGAMINALLDWLLSAQATEVYGKGPQLLGFFALFNMAVGVASFVMQTSVTRPILEKKGLGSTIKSQPGSIAAGVVLALIAPYFVSILLLRFLEAVTRSSLYRSAYELFYTPLPPAKKRATKTLIDVGVDRVGTLVGSAALLGIAHLSHEAATKTVLFASLGLAGICWYVASRLQDGYVSALASSLKSGAVALDDDTEDLTTKKTLAETTALLDREKLLQRIEEFQKQKDARIALGQTAGSLGTTGLRTDTGSSRDVVEASSVETADPILVKASALASGDVGRIKKVLAHPIPPKLVPYVVPLLANDTVVRDVVRSLRKTANKTTGLLLDHLLDPEVDVRVRRRIPRVLKVCRTQRAASGLLFGLRDPTFEVRVQVGLALAQIAEEAVITIAPDTVFDIVLHELTAGRSGWSEETPGGASVDADEARNSGAGSIRPPPPSEKRDEALYRGLSHVFTVLGLVLEREPLSIAYRALRSEDGGLRGTAFEYLDVVLPPSVRDVLVPLLGDVKPMSARPRNRGRDSKELAAELLRSSGSLARPRT